MPELDMLRDMFQKQTELNRRIGVDCVNMPEAEQPKWILNYCRAMTQEIAELTDSVPWKWWAKYQKFDPQNARVEVVDLFHFLISAALVLGLSADDVHRIYLEKNRVNIQRQDSGYTTKDENDNQSIGR
jgi:dimeric dUTPase (all-alpha-NTP-PPase superfamily)